MCTAIEGLSHYVVVMNQPKKALCGTLGQSIIVPKVNLTNQNIAVPSTRHPLHVTYI